jgi:signal peptidase I
MIMKNILNNIFNFIKIIFTILLIVMVVTLAATTFPLTKKIKIQRVMSGSMEPALRVGSIVLSQKIDTAELKPGDIITFNSVKEQGGTITHRIKSISKVQGATFFTVKGDANKSADVDPVKVADIQGKVLFTIPLLGYVSVWMKTPIGFIVLVILPAAIIIISEIWNIKNALEESIKKKYEKRETLIKNDV